MDSFGDRMKMYEGRNEPTLIPLLPVCIRLDGKAFHTFTKDLERPYDKRFVDLMVATTEFLVKETNAKIGYTQSDEISLILMSGDIHSEVYFAGRVPKILSVLASKCSVFFNKNLGKFLPGKDGDPVFDCRVWNVPNKMEAVNTLIWREQDATRNSIQSAGQSVFSHKQLHKKNCNEIQEMLSQNGINWNDYPNFFKRGTYIQNRRMERPFTPNEIDKLPPKHAARSNPNLKVMRSNIIRLDLPKITSVINIQEVVFEGQEPCAPITAI